MNKIFMVTAVKENTISEYIIWADTAEMAISAVKHKYPLNIWQVDDYEAHKNFNLEYFCKAFTDDDWCIDEDEQSQILNINYKHCRNNRKCIITLFKNAPQYFSGCICKVK